MKKHLKRLAAPRSWNILRKEARFITHPQPGGHRLSSGLPLLTILRDMLHYGQTAREVQKILHATEVQVNGKHQQDHRFLVGLFDIVSIPALKESYRIILDKKGRLMTTKIDEKERTVRIAKVIGKTVTKKNTIQYHLHDGSNLLLDKNANVGDTLVLSVPDNTVKELLPLREGMHIFLSQGKHAGDSGVLKTMSGHQVVYRKEEHDIETAKRYVFVTGKEKPLITL